MHGHRHVDWIGACGGLRIVSAPSPSWRRRTKPTSFLIHRLAAAPNGRLGLLAPERIEIAGSAAVAVSAAP